MNELARLGILVCFALAGALLYALSAPSSKASEIGRLALAAGLFALAFALAAHLGVR